MKHKHSNSNQLHSQFNRSLDLQSEFKSNATHDKPFFGGCCGKETLEKSDTSIWLKDKRIMMKPIPKYKEYQSPKSEKDKPGSPHRGQWDHQTLNYFSNGKSSNFKSIGKKTKNMDSDDSPQRYKQISLKYDMERDTRLAQAEKQLLKSKNINFIDDIMQLTEFQEMKMRIEWDVAWRIFDHVNEGNDTTKYIDLHCLDVFEAESITKQCIYEAARKV